MVEPLHVCNARPKTFLCPLQDIFASSGKRSLGRGPSPALSPLMCRRGGLTPRFTADEAARSRSGRAGIPVGPDRQECLSYRRQEAPRHRSWRACSVLRTFVSAIRGKRLVFPPAELHASEAWEPTLLLPQRNRPKSARKTRSKIGRRLKETVRRGQRERNGALTPNMAWHPRRGVKWLSSGRRIKKARPGGLASRPRYPSV
jgi:hypothetical protein